MQHLLLRDQRRASETDSASDSNNSRHHNNPCRDHPEYTFCVTPSVPPPSPTAEAMAASIATTTAQNTPFSVATQVPSAPSSSPPLLQGAQSDNAPTSSSFTATASATSAPSSDSSTIPTGAIVGIVIGALVFSIILAFNVFLLCRKRQQQRKRSMEVGKASRVDLADSELNRSNFYGVQQQHHHGETNPIASWLLERAGRGHSSRHHNQHQHQHFLSPPLPAKNIDADLDWDGDTLPYTSDLPTSRSPPPPPGRTLTRSILGGTRRSMGTLSSTSDSRSQGSMVIGSPAFWAAIDTKVPISPTSPTPPLPSHRPKSAKSKKSVFKVHNPDGKI